MSSPAPSPRRCFVMDLPAIISYSHRGQQSGANALTASSQMVRLMGTVVSMQEASNETSSASEICREGARGGLSSYGNSEDGFMLLELDDGTGSIVCVAPMSTMDRLATLQVGNMIDCIGRLSLQCAHAPDGGETIVIQVDTLLEVRGESAVAERLRWLEITQLQHCCKSSSSVRHDGPVLWQGYPCPDISSDDILQIIESNEREGVNLSDLALVMDIEEPHAKALIEDLQLKGLIYQNEKGFFVPL